jgi:hypothetical protein
MKKPVSLLARRFVNIRGGSLVEPLIALGLLSGSALALVEHQSGLHMQVNEWNHHQFARQRLHAVVEEIVREGFTQDPCQTVPKGESPLDKLWWSCQTHPHPMQAHTVQVVVTVKTLPLKGQNDPRPVFRMQTLITGTPGS